MKFEYLILDGLGENEEALDRLGATGWELVSAVVLGGHGYPTFYFKRTMIDFTIETAQPSHLEAK